MAMLAAGGRAVRGRIVERQPCAAVHSPGYVIHLTWEVGAFVS